MLGHLIWDIITAPGIIQVTRSRGLKRAAGELGMAKRALRAVSPILPPHVGEELLPRHKSSARPPVRVR
jgi:hypothetical protein